MHPHVKVIMEEVGETDPIRAVRAKARDIVSRFVSTFGESPPFDLEALASFVGLRISEEAPRHSEDSEIAPENGEVVLRINRERAFVRQRFSIGHEIGHTLFPGFHLAVQCRKPAERDWADPQDHIESLCDVAASEFLFPAPWFDGAATEMPLTAAGVLALANRFLASPEATIRRLIETWQTPAAALFCSCKLKPTEVRRVAADRDQRQLFGSAATSIVRKLRVDYCLSNDAFRVACTGHVPRDKSIPLEGAILEAATGRRPSDGVAWMDLGTASGEFFVHAVPIYSPPDQLGPDGTGSVAIIVRPR